MTVDGLDDLVAVVAGAGFDQVWRGYDPRQVDRFLDRLDVDIDSLIVERDDACRRRRQLTDQLAAAQAENHRLREIIDSVCRTPVDRTGLEGRLVRMVELAEAEAMEATRTAEGDRRRATEEHVAELRRRQDQVHSACERIEQDFVVALRSRRAEINEAMRRDREDARAEAHQLISEARAEAGRIRAAVGTGIPTTTIPGPRASGVTREPVRPRR
jgi:DivIVA domain-containing protein